MTNQAIGAFIVLSLFISLGVASGYGQHPLQASIPFDFFVGKTVLPAGEYSVEIAGTARSVLLIRSADWRSSVFTLTHAIEFKTRQDEPRLIFNRYGDRYFLSQVLSSGSTGREVVKSTLERELAVGGVTRVTTSVAANLRLEKRIR